MERKNNDSSLGKTLLELVLAIGSLLIAVLGVVFMMIKTLDWKGLFSGAKALLKDFNKANAVNFVKANKKALCVLVVFVCVLLILSESLFYRPVDMDFGDSDNDYGYYGYSGYSGYVDDDCKNCYGTGDCPHCNGSGIYRNYGLEVECKACDGWGNCSSCDGTGEK